jgi:hypothetical protein
VILLVFAMASVSAHAQSCTRDSMKALIADYFEAVATHDMSALPTAENLRITENGHEVELGEGFFASGGKTHLLRSIIDTERCGSVSQAITDETIDGEQTLAVMAVRLKAEEGKVSEIEVLVTREAELARYYDPETLLKTKDQDWTTLLPADKRPTREYMNGEADKYFDSFVEEPKEIPNFATPCNRWEGGMLATPDGDCTVKNLVLTHSHRRYPVTDLELGATAGFVNFVEVLPDVHIFKFNEDAEIDNIQAVFGGQQKDAIWPDEE